MPMQSLLRGLDAELALVTREAGAAALDWGSRARIAAITFAAYYGGASLGMALTFQPAPVSVLWPPNAIVLALLLLVPTRAWWVVIAAALPAHVTCELQAGVPPAMVAGWFVSNMAEAVAGAVLFRRLAGGAPRFDRLNHVTLFLGAAAVSVMASSFLDSALVRLVGWGTQTFWEVWLTRLFSNLTADVVIVPAVLAVAALPAVMRHATRAHVVEAVALAVGLVAVTTVVFNSDLALVASPAQVYLPLAFLLWAALRFGPAGVSLAFGAVVLAAIWGAGHGTGALGARSPIENAHSVQLFALSVGPVLLCLAAAIAERRSGEEDVRMGDRRFRMVLEATNDTVYERNVRTGALWWSRNGRSYLGYARTHDLPDSEAMLAAAIHPEDRHHALQLQESALRDGSATWEAEFRLQRADGSYTHVQEQAFIVRDAEGTPLYVVGMLTDITERRDTEELHHRLSHASRLTTLGELAASIAHEINQPITAILMNVEAARTLLESGRGSDDEFRDIVEDIRADDLRASEIVRHFRNLAAKRAVEVEAFDLNEVVRGVMRIALPTARRRGMTLRPEHADIPFARADRVHVQQVLLNLIFNGMDAMGDKAAHERILTVKTSPAGDDQVRVSVRDTGHGIAARDLPRIFDSFYTTKRDGLGLGLSIARSLVAGWGGRIWADNNDEGGATFTFIVPAAMAPPAARGRG